MTGTTPNPNKALWEKGDFTRIAAAMRESGEKLVKDIGVTRGLKVLDLGCGDGTTAMDLANVRFQEGDACNLSELKDASFDLTVSIFGAMFAPKPMEVAKEMVRVTKPGGRIVMGNWIPGDPTVVAQILKISAAYSPPPPAGFISPMLWGVEKEVTERFEGAGIAKDKISFVRDTYVFNYRGAPAAYVQEFRNFYGPTMNAFAAAEANGKAADLQKELETLFNTQNTSGKDMTSLPATFLRVTVKR
jgi:SAM-dependent methyltransferase